MHSIVKRLLALAAALLIAVACSQTPASTPQTDNDSPAVTSPDSSPSDDAGESPSDDAGESPDASEDASPS